MYLRNGRVGVFDLGSGEASEQTLEETQDLDSMSSLKIADRLISEHGAEALVLGTGPLTGSFAPASCCGIVRAGGKNPRVVPLLGFAGVELKMSGFDFVVVKGSSRDAGYIWIRDGIIEFREAGQMEALDSWARTDRIRTDQGDAKIQVVTCGPWGTARLAASQLLTNYWGGEDKSGMASEFGRRNLVAVAFRGMGEIEMSEPEGHFEEALLLMRGHIEKLGEIRGLKSYFEGVDRPDFAELAHRHVACYGCPHPCRTFLKISEDPSEMKLVGKEPGYLHYDVAALEKAFQLGADARTASEVISECAKAGAEPVAVMSRLEDVGASLGAKEAREMLASPEDIRPAGAHNYERSFGGAEDYGRCLGLGLCPRYWAKAGFDPGALASLVQSALGSSGK